MQKKRISFVFNHFQHQDGVCRSAIALANLLAERNDVSVDLIIIYRFDSKCLSLLSPKVNVKVIIGYYLRGLDKIFKVVPRIILYNKYLKNNYDVEIAFQSGTSYEIVSAVEKPSNILRIGWVHGYDASGQMISLYKQMDKMICVSKHNADRLYHDLNGEVPVDFCYNPINENYVCELSTEKIDIKKEDNAIQFVTVGRLSLEKGYARLIKVMKKLKNEHYRFSLWIIGDGPEYKSLSNFIINNGMNDCIFLLGSQTNPHKYTAKADVFVCSSYSEGYSTACTEAIILGIPVITTNVSGAEEIISAAQCGIKTELDDESLYIGLKYILDNPLKIIEWKNTIYQTRKEFESKERFKQFLKIVELS